MNHMLVRLKAPQLRLLPVGGERDYPYTLARALIAPSTPIAA